MKIAIASLGDPRAVKTWSGIPAHIIRELESLGHDIIPITLLPPDEPWYYDWNRRIYYRLQKGWFLSAVEERILKQIGKQFDEEVAKANLDVVVVIHGDFLAYTTFKKPVCIIHDATFASLVDYYPDFTNLSSRSIKAGNQMYKKALDRAHAAVFSAAWASQSALRDYKVDPEKIHTIPFGANLHTIPDAGDVSKWIAVRSTEETCWFLFLGVNWDRKGGPDALRFIKALNHLGIHSKLIVVGCTAVVSHEDGIYIEQVGFLRKNILFENQRLEGLFKKSQALLLPSMAECYGCVYCEANAYGLPALGRNTGGVSEIIKNQVNGLLLEPDETPESFAGRWKIIWENKENYTALSFSSREEYEKRLNYKVFVNKLEIILNGIVNKVPFYGIYNVLP